MPRLDRLWYEIDAQTKGFDEGILQSENRLKSFTEYAKGNPIAVLGALGVAAVLAGIKLANMAAEFEKQMAMVNTVLDPTQASLKDLSNGLLEVNASLPVENVRELTKGLYDIISSGIPAGDALEFLNVAAKAAVGGVTSVASAVDGLTTAVNAFRSQGLTVERASDVMFQAVNKGKITFDELSHAMGLGASIAAGVGIKFTDLNAAVAQLSLGGMDARMAMVGVRSAIVNIMKPQEDFIKTFPQIAAEFNRAKLEARGFTGFLTDLVAASKGNSEVFVKLFNDVQGFNAVMALTTDGGKGMNQMLKDVENSVGAADTAAAKMGATTSATNQILKNQFHNELVLLGQDVLPAYNSVLEAAVFWMERLGSAAGKTHLKEMMDEFRTLGMSGKDKIEFKMFSWDSQKQTGQMLAFINMVKENKELLKSYTNTELQQAIDGMKRFGNSFPDFPGFDDTVRKMTELMAERTKATDEASARQLKANQQATAGAVIFTDANAKTVAALGQNVNALQRGEEAATQYKIAVQQLKEANVEAQQAALDAKKANETGDKSGAEAAQKAAGEALGKATAARQTARQALKDIDEARKAKENEARSTQERLVNEAKARRDLGFALDEALTKTTATTVDDLALALAKQVAEFRAKLVETKGLTPEDHAAKSKKIDDIEAANKRALDLLRTSEKVNAVLNEVDKATLGLLSDTANADLFRSIDGQVIDLIDSLKDVDSSTTEFKTKSADILRLEQARAKLMQYFMGLSDKAVTAAEKEATARERSRRAMEKMARDIQSVAAGALDLGKAFGIVNDATAQALNNIIGIAANLPGALSGDPEAIGGLLTSLAGLVSGIFGHEEDPAVTKARQDNIQALKDLTHKMGDVAKANVSGSQITGVSGVLNKYLSDLLGGKYKNVSLWQFFDVTGKALTDALDKVGMSFADLQDFAKQFGVTLRDLYDTEGLQALQAAIAVADYAAYISTYAGALSRLNDEFTVFNVTDPTERLRRTIAFLTSAKGIPGIANALKGIDTSTAGGAAQAIAALQKLWEDIAAGNITPEMLGGATVDEATQAVMNLIAQLRGEGGSGGTSQSFGYNATITEVTGSHIAGLLGSANVFAQRTMVATEAMVELLRMSGGSLGTLWPPSGGLASGKGVIEITLNVNVTGMGDGAVTVGRAIGRAALDEINTGLAGRLRERRRALGNATIVE